MKATLQLLPGAWLISLQPRFDRRGVFVKTYAASIFGAQALRFDFAEEYYSISAKNVIRGMHFQVPPYDHTKMVYCASGAVKDVLLDLRSGPSYGKVAEVILSSSRPSALLIPAGVAHGFLSLEDDSLMVYKTSTEYVPKADSGIRWDSFSYDWRPDADPILSDRDAHHVAFSEFKSPF